VTDPDDLVRQEDVVRRLRELHATVSDEDRPRAALNLGLAITDLMLALPDGNPRQGELAREGLSRLDESDADSPAVLAAKQRLTRFLTASQGPESFQFVGGDLNWDLDWEALRGPTEASRNLTATLPWLASMLPPQAPLRRALADITGVIGAFDQGQWSPHHDEVLASAIREVEAGGLGSELGITLRLVATMVRVYRCRLAEQQGKQPDWPSLAEFDGLIADLESVDDQAMGFSGPFQAMGGLQHLYIAGLVMMRLHVDIHRRDVPRDRAWRDDTLARLGRADYHLQQTPSSYAGPVQHMRANLANAVTALSQVNLPPAAPPRPAPEAAPGGPAGGQRLVDHEPHQTAENQPDPDPAGAFLAEADASHLAAPSWTLDGSFSKIASPEVLAGFQALAAMTGGSIVTSLSRLGSVLQAIFARRWTEKAEQELAALRQEADRLAAEPESSLSDRAVVTAILAMARASQWHVLSVSPRPDERPSAEAVASVIAEVESALELLSTAAARFPSLAMLTELQGLLHAQAATLLTDLGRPDGPRSEAGLIERARDHMAQVPSELFDQLPPVVSDVFLLQRVVGDGKPPDPAEAERLAERFGEALEASGAGLTVAHHAVDAAKQSRDPAAIGSAISELNKAGIALAPGSPQRAHMLTLRAEMQTLLALHTNYPLALADALASAIDAIRAAATPAEKRPAVQRLITVFSLMAARGQREGPFEQAEELLRSTLADASANDWPLRLMALTGIAATVGLRAVAIDDQDLRQVAVRLIANAEQLLPEAGPSDEWYSAARTLSTWTAVHALTGPATELVPVALRVIDQLEGVLVSNPGTAGSDGDASARAKTVAGELKTLREQRTHLLAARAEPTVRPEPITDRERSGRPEPVPDPEEVRQLARRGLDQAAALLDRAGPDGLPRRPLASVGRPEPAPLRAVLTDLHAALAGLFDDVDLRRQIDTALGRCAAELYWADPAAQTVETLRDAVVHLNRTLASGEHALPTTGRADLLNVLARCWHEVALRHDQEEERAQARTEAGRAARAAVRELARCVLLTGDTGQALGVAARANEVVARSVGWCLADGQDRAAVEMAEAGRGLVLAGVVLAGRVEEVLRGAGRDDVADAWRKGDEAGRIAALNALWDTSVSTTLLAAPTADQVSIMLAPTNVDAVVYLVPPTPADRGQPAGADQADDQPGYAILVRPLPSTIEVRPLPGLGGPGGEPLAAYLATLDDALASFDPAAGNEEGFRGGPREQAWADALVRLGGWAYDRIMGPLIEHTDGWRFGHRPHLALIPLGELTAIPYGAAWTDEGAPAGARRYAIDDLVLTYAASARLLGEVARRPRQPLTERVVLVSDLTGEFPMARRATTVLAGHQYPDAEVYGLKSAPDGPATTAVLLGALPGRDRPGASLLQLSTHATTEPTPQLQSSDGWLPLSRILQQARNRPVDAPGGLIITNACLSDITRTDYDESLTLATAFLAAGATGVIGTRWPIDDDTAAVLSLRLHYHLQLGRTPADALRCAQLDLIRPEPGMAKTLGRDFADIEEARLSHPASWAGYVHHGVTSGLKEPATMTDAHPGDRPEDPLSQELARHWDDIRDRVGDEQWRRLRALAEGLGGPDPAEARAALIDLLFDLLPRDHPVIRALRTRTLFLRPGATTRPPVPTAESSTVPVTIYLSDERIHQQVEDAVEELLATAGLGISHREDPVAGSWFRRMAATVKAGMDSPAAREAMATAAHAAESQLVLAQDAVVTATLLQNVPPLLGALQPTKDAVIRAGALLIVKVDWTVNVIQLTAAQQLALDHHPQLARSPQEIVAVLDVMPPGHPGNGQAGQLGPPLTGS
jgi:CHAT domain